MVVLYRNTEPFLRDYWTGTVHFPWLTVGWGESGRLNLLLAEALLRDALEFEPVTDDMVRAFCGRFVDHWPWPGAWQIEASTIKGWHGYYEAAQGFDDDEGVTFDDGDPPNRYPEGCNTPPSTGRGTE
jgi:hypothetical protein